MSRESLVAYGEVRGFLAAFADVNSRGDLCCTFEFAAMPEARDLIEAVDRHLNGLARKISLTPIPNWNEVIARAFLKWMFNFLADRDRILIPRSLFWLANQNSQESIVSWLMERVEAAAPDPTVYSVSFLMDVHYECAADDFVFSAGGQAYFLHLGISD